MTQMQHQTEPLASQSSVRLVLRHPDDARHLTGQQLGWLSLGLRGDVRGSLDGLLEDIQLERAQLWSIERGPETRALIVTRIIHHELCDTFEIQICAGIGVREWVHVISELEEHARKLGCRMVEMMGRPGWIRLLKQYRVRGISMEREL